MPKQNYWLLSHIVINYNSVTKNVTGQKQSQKITN